MVLRGNEYYHCIHCEFSYKKLPKPEILFFGLQLFSPITPQLHTICCKSNRNMTNFIDGLLCCSLICNTLYSVMCWIFWLRNVDFRFPWSEGSNVRGFPCGLIYEKIYTNGIAWILIGNRTGHYTIKSFSSTLIRNDPVFESMNWFSYKTVN